MEDRRLPEFVFRGSWALFALLDSDVLFSGAFVPIGEQLRRVEGASCLALVNLDEEEYAPTSGLGPYCFADDASGEEFEAFLTQGPDADVVGWRYVADRFACASNVGEWCIYSEKADEFAIFAVRRPDTIGRFRDIVSALGAVSVADAFRLPLVANLSENVVLPDFRSKMLQHYG